MSVKFFRFTLFLFIILTIFLVTGCKSDDVDTSAPNWRTTPTAIVSPEMAVVHVAELFALEYADVLELIDDFFYSPFLAGLTKEQEILGVTAERSRINGFLVYPNVNIWEEGDVFFLVARDERVFYNLNGEEAREGVPLITRYREGSLTLRNFFDEPEPEPEPEPQPEPEPEPEPDNWNNDSWLSLLQPWGDSFIDYFEQLENKCLEFLDALYDYMIALDVEPERLTELHNASDTFLAGVIEQNTTLIQQKVFLDLQHFSENAAGLSADERYSLFNDINNNFDEGFNDCVELWEQTILSLDYFFEDALELDMETRYEILFVFQDFIQNVFEQILTEWNEFFGTVQSTLL
jgi:hypothetical protein